MKTRNRTGDSIMNGTPPLNALKIDERLQMRVESCQEHISEMAEHLQEDKSFELPPVTVFQDTEGTLWLTDGFQRYEAYRLADRAHIPADVRLGSFRDSWRYALGANARHGLKRSWEDKRKAVNAALDDEETAQLSIRDLHKLCNVSTGLVVDMKNERAGKKPVPTGPGGRRKATDGATGDTAFAVRMNTSEHNNDQTGVIVAADAPGTVAIHQPFQEVVVDHFGRPVPERLQEVFWVVKRFRSIVNAIGAIKTQVGQLREDGGDGTIFLRVNTICADLQNAQSLLSSMAPHVVCPQCDGRPGVCKPTDTCGGVGWVRSDSYPHFTSEMKSKCESYRGLNVHGAEKESA